MRIRRGSLLLLVFLLLAASAAIGYAETNPEIKGYTNDMKNKWEHKTLNRDFAVKIKSGNLTTSYQIEDALRDIDTFGLNTMNVPVQVDVESLTSDDMTINAESEKKAIQLIKILNRKGINVILEPYPWIHNGDYYETKWQPANLNMFFWNWKTKVLKPIIEDVAVPYHVDAVNVASNLVYMEPATGYWTDTIDYVRSSYKGLVTYRTNWWYTADWDQGKEKEYQVKLNNPLFAKVDFISVAAYFELTGNDTNTADNLTQSIRSSQIYHRQQNIYQELKNFHDTWQKPVFFGELGFPATNRASAAPWDFQTSKIANDEEQANCFEAYRRVFEKEPWHLGFSIFAIGSRGADNHYYPSAKSQQVIRNWYNSN